MVWQGWKKRRETHPHAHRRSPFDRPTNQQDKKDLFKLVALNNKILTDAMSSGLLEQSKPAWNFNRLDALWNGAREFGI